MTTRRWSEYVRRAREARAELFRLQEAKGLHYSARCCCYRGGPGHSSNSGRCSAREVWSPDDSGVCEQCRETCKKTPTPEE